MLTAFLALAWCFTAVIFGVVCGPELQCQLPTPYRLSAVWGGHEGSLLLWVFMLSGWAVAVAHFLARWMRPWWLASSACWPGHDRLCCCLSCSPPIHLPGCYRRQKNRRDLNPLLQDPGLVFHPPMLYMGYVGFGLPLPLLSLHSSLGDWTQPGRVGRDLGPLAPGCF